MNSLFSATTDAIVIQKKAPGHCDESTMARITVIKNNMISIIKLQTMRFVRSPLLKK